ncbi:hypothetical protein Tco_0370348 [Tanacetum coccineum]
MLTFLNIHFQGGRIIIGKKTNIDISTGSVTESDGILNDATPFVDASVAKEVVSPSVVDETVVKEKQSPMVNTTGLGSSQETTTAGNAPGKSSYANVTGKPSGTKVNFRTLFTPGGNGIDVVIPVESIRAISERFVNTAYAFFLGNSMEGLDEMLENGPWFIHNNPLILKKWHPDVNLLKEDVGTPLMFDSYTSDICMHSWDRSSYSRAMIKLRANVELKDNIVVVFGHIQEECPKNIGTGETKNLKKTSQTPKGIPVGQKIGFKPTKQVFQLVSIKPTANTSVNKKKNVEPTKEVSKSNPFEVLTSVENDKELVTNGGTSNLASQATNSSGSSFWNVDASSPSSTPIVEKIDKIEKLIIEGKVTLVDDEGKPLKKVASSCEYDSEDEVASVDNEMANFLAKKDGYGTQSLLE